MCVQKTVSSQRRRVEMVLTIIIDLRTITGNPTFVKNYVPRKSACVETIREMAANQANAMFHRNSYSKYQHVRSIGRDTQTQLSKTVMSGPLSWAIENHHINSKQFKSDMKTIQPVKTNRLVQFSMSSGQSCEAKQSKKKRFTHVREHMGVLLHFTRELTAINYRSQMPSTLLTIAFLLFCFCSKWYVFNIILYATYREL